jgi:hypothetical protein
MLGKLTITREDSTFCGIAIAGIEAVARGESGSRPHSRLTQTRWKKSNLFSKSVMHRALNRSSRLEARDGKLEFSACRAASNA